jgi:molybdopterin-binding protein
MRTRQFAWERTAPAQSTALPFRAAVPRCRRAQAAAPSRAAAALPFRAAVPRCRPAPRFCAEIGIMKLSARNQLPGTVEQVVLGTIMARVVVNVGGHVIESVITRQSAEDLGLKDGDAVTVVIKSTSVMVQKG